MIKPPSGVKADESEVLIPNIQPIKIKGKLIYNESGQAHNIIRLAKEILYNYPQLKEKSSSFNYNMIVPRSHVESIKLIEEIGKDNQKVPILLFFERSEDKKDTEIKSF